MIQCPNCQATLPDWQQTCQFCQTDTKSVARPTGQGFKSRQNPLEAPKWVWGAYYGLSVYWIVEGMFGIANQVVVLSNQEKNPLGFFVLFPYAMILLSFVSVVLGIGLLVRNNTCRGIANFAAGIKILFGICGLAGSAIGALFSGWYGILMMFDNVFNIASAAFLIYLIGETDKFCYHS